MIYRLILSTFILNVVEVTSQEYRCVETVMLVTSSRDDSGVVIQSPNYPENYPSGVDMCWLITTDDPYVTVHVYPYNLESGYDYVYIYDGLDTAHTQLARLTGEGPDTTTYQSTGSAVFLTFTTDSGVNRQGFLACVCAAAISPCDCGVDGHLLDLWSSPGDHEDDFDPFFDDDFGPDPMVIISTIVPLFFGLFFFFACFIGGVKMRARHRTAAQQAQTVTVTPHKPRPPPPPPPPPPPEPPRVKNEQQNINVNVNMIGVPAPQPAYGHPPVAPYHPAPMPYPPAAYPPGPGAYPPGPGAYPQGPGEYLPGPPMAPPRPPPHYPGRQMHGVYHT